MRWDGAIRVQEPKPFRLVIRIPARVNGTTLPHVSREPVKADLRAAQVHALSHPVRIVLARAVVDNRNPPW